MTMLTSGVRCWFCHEAPSTNTTRTQTWVFAPISSIVFLNWEFMVAGCGSGMAILTLFGEVLKHCGSASLRVPVAMLLRFFPLALSLASGGALAQPCCAPPQTPAEALFRSIENGDAAEFARLLDSGVDLSVKNKNGETPLYVAAEKGQIEMA